MTEQAQPVRRRYGPSAQWEHINEAHITEAAVADLAGFKSNGVNFKLALWNPHPNGVRYLKALTFALGMRLSPANRERLRRTRNREVGDPYSVRCDGESVCLDYLQAVHEVEVMAANVALDGAQVVEIGAGYGRTCHTMASNHDLAGYTIIDLPNTLELSRRYLRTVLTPEQFAKIRFVGIDEIDEQVRGHRFDLCVNVDSFAEMSPDTVRDYLALIDETCAHFYVNNPVGKYLDKSLDGHSQGAAVVELALSSGLLRDVIDIHDSEAVLAKVPAFVSAYRPGEGWECVAQERSVTWSYYWQALYRAAPVPR
ncbi:putative sugar O-methyltransferase [Amycolatopsis sp. OK19-0408]|uniref:Sugar O-methyltransferase n=1 Tax=Amycolatopsis iheyensis TaxID=2945988 RepID=A0A9X2NLK0_9PSEU|nr:putative sugar O-methyltransferase [Amycolatopsis iheyensis]MCR6488749.1 putative sugar O-methyltransferase [Amycolatopsis iheyensis]